MNFGYVTENGVNSNGSVICYEMIFIACGFGKKEIYYTQFIIPRKTGGIAL